MLGVEFVSSHITIIGAGFSGAAVAIYLLREASFPVRITLVDKSGQFGYGAAYSTTKEEHLLNVPAGKMSLYPDNPNHFFDWAVARDLKIAPGSFLGRTWYGMYINEELKSAANAAVPDVTLDQIQDQAVHVQPYNSSEYHIILKSGNSITTNFIILALGNFPPKNPGGTQNDPISKIPDTCKTLGTLH